MTFVWDVTPTFILIWVSLIEFRKLLITATTREDMKLGVTPDGTLVGVGQR